MSKVTVILYVLYGYVWRIGCFFQRISIWINNVYNDFGYVFKYFLLYLSVLEYASGNAFVFITIWFLIMDVFLKIVEHCKIRVVY